MRYYGKSLYWVPCLWLTIIGVFDLPEGRHWYGLDVALDDNQLPE